MLSSSADPDLRRIAWQVEGADMGPASQQEYRRYKADVRRWLEKDAARRRCERITAMRFDCNEIADLMNEGTPCGTVATVRKS